MTPDVEQVEAQTAAMRLFLQRQRDAWDTAVQIEMVEKGYITEAQEFIDKLDEVLAGNAGKALLRELEIEREQKEMRHAAWLEATRERDEGIVRAEQAEAEVQRLRQRTHELQERHDKAHAELQRKYSELQAVERHNAKAWYTYAAENARLRRALLAYMEPAGDTPVELRAQAKAALGICP